MDRLTEIVWPVCIAVVVCYASYNLAACQINRDNMEAKYPHSFVAQSTTKYNTGPQQ